MSDRCFQCHGNSRKAGLRLDIEGIAFLNWQVGKAFSSSSIYKSKVAHRILSNDPLDQMPPPESKLNFQTMKNLILRWIDQVQNGRTWSFITQNCLKFQKI